MRNGIRSLTVLSLVAIALAVVDARAREYETKSGIKIWVDPATPDNRQVYTCSRGKQWDLVMSDEFNEPSRDFAPGEDHMWTALEKPDGVNGAQEIYSRNMTSTECDDKGNCYYYIKVIDDPTNVRVYNQYLNPPTFQDVMFFYRAGMVQSWNKFCFQGGMLEVRAQLPGAVSEKSQNPDLARGPLGKTTSDAKLYYPTWPGIWLLGNLGRAIFSASTNRMWPFSYNECDESVFDSANQRISACDSNPGYGLNPNQGRGAPEIDVLEGGGIEISSSLQIAPGMPNEFRLFPVDGSQEVNFNTGCLYDGNCVTPGANHIDVPAKLYAARGHKSWYQGLRYASNPFCKPDPTRVQDHQTVQASVKKGVLQNTCGVENCPGSKDVNADLSLIDGVGPGHWGINSNGTCFPVMNAYMGSYLCDPDNQDRHCSSPRKDGTPKSNIMTPFNYQLDAISSNWPVHLGAYLDFLVYQIEWVTGENGYVRWMLDGHVIFEITSDAFSVVPQGGKEKNPKKIMLEEPMYVIFNVALSSSWGAKPPNPGQVCRGDGSKPDAVRVCNEFPMYMKIDYIRLYQDLDPNRNKDDLMQIGCDPESHPTREWILGHIDEYQDWDNMALDVSGRGFCETDDDCTVARTGSLELTSFTTGSCVKKRCKCKDPHSWGGPRCTFAMADLRSAADQHASGFGPPMEVPLAVAGVVVLLTLISLWYSARMSAAEAQAAQKAALTRQYVENAAAMKENAEIENANNSSRRSSSRQGPVSVDYGQNFV